MMEKYLMKDWNERENIGWVVETDCPRDKLEEFVGLSHEYSREDKDSAMLNNRVVDFDDCWGDSEYLIRMIEHCGYMVNVYEFDYDHIISW